MPALALLVVGPLMGLAYAIFLPLIGFAMVGGIVLRKVGELAVRPETPAAACCAPPGSPRAPSSAAADPQGRRDRGDREGADSWAEEVERELDDDDETRVAASGGPSRRPRPRGRGLAATACFQIDPQEGPTMKRLTALTAALLLFAGLAPGAQRWADEVPEAISGCLDCHGEEGFVTEFGDGTR